MKNKKYLPLYKKWMKAGKMLPVDGALCPRTSGLCDALEDDYIFKLMTPTSEDFCELESDGLNSFAWGSGYPDYRWHEFTPLRQTIVLFCAALNGEL